MRLKSGCDLTKKIGFNWGSVNHWTILYLAIGLLIIGLLGCSRERTLPAGSQDTSAGSPIPAVNSQPVLIGHEAQIAEVEIQVLESDPVQINAIVRGQVSDGCVIIERLEQSRTEDTFWLNVVTARQLEAECTNEPQIFGEGIHLDTVGLPTGTYTVTANSANAMTESFFLSPEMVIAPEPTPGPAVTMINGILWADVCTENDDGSPGLGCVDDGSGTLQPDGLLGEDEARIPGVLVELRLGECPGSTVVATVASGINGAFQFEDLETGFYCVSITTETAPNTAILASGIWTHPTSDFSPAARPGQTTISLGPNQKQTANFGWSYAAESAAIAEAVTRDSDTSPPASETTTSESETTETNDSPSPTDDGPELDCVDASAYIADITIPDDTLISAGEAFTKTWRVRNTGTCTWGAGYSFIFADGEQMSAPDTIPFQVAVPPEREVAISVPMAAPTEPGTYRSDWKIQSVSGEVFASRGDFAYYVQIVVAAESE